MDLREAKATSRLLHALAGDTVLDPASAAAVIETLSHCAGTTLQVGSVLTRSGLDCAVTTTTHPNAAGSNPETPGGF